MYVVEPVSLAYALSFPSVARTNVSCAAFRIYPAVHSAEYALGGVLDFPAPRHDVVRWPHRAPGVLPRRDRDPTSLAERTEPRGPGRALPVSARARESPGGHCAGQSERCDCVRSTPRPFDAHPKPDVLFNASATPFRRAFDSRDPTLPVRTWRARAPTNSHRPPETVMHTDATTNTFQFPGTRMRRRRTVAAQPWRMPLTDARRSPARMVAHDLRVSGQRACSDFPAPRHIVDTLRAHPGGCHGR